MVGFIAPITSHTQHILIASGKYGLSALDGSTLLPLEYDSIYQPKSRYQSSSWICKKEGKYGIYNHSDKWFSELIFDEVKEDNESGILTMRQGEKWGFMTLQGEVGDSKTDKAPPTKYIAPLYDAIWSNDRIHYSQRFLHVKNENHFGVLSAYSGDTLVPIRFSMGLTEFEHTPKLPLFISGQYRDNPNDSMYVYNPNTDVTMAFHQDSRLEIQRSFSLLVGVNNYYDDLHGMVEVYDYESGKRLFHVDIPEDNAVCDLHHLKAELLNNRTIKVLTEHQMLKGVSNQYTIMCYDIYTGYRYFEYDGPKFFDLELKPQSDGTDNIYRRSDYMKYPEKDIIGLKKADGAIIWYYEKYRKP